MPRRTPASLKWLLRKNVCGTCAPASPRQLGCLASRDFDGRNNFSDFESLSLTLISEGTKGNCQADKAMRSFRLIPFLGGARAQNLSVVWGLRVIE